MAEYNQNASKSCCFSSSVSEFTAAGGNNSTGAIATRIEESLNCKSKSYRDNL